MIHSHRCTAYSVTLRPVERADAAVIVGLRTDPKLSRFIGGTSSAQADQQSWLESYFARPGDAYFIIEVGSDPVGTVGIYDQRGDVAEWGRWIIRPGVAAAAASVLLTYRVAFTELKLERLICRTVSDNGHVLSFHDRLGLRRIGVETAGVIIDGAPKDMVVHELSREDWLDVEPGLERSARMAERLLLR